MTESFYLEQIQNLHIQNKHVQHVPNSFKLMFVSEIDKERKSWCKGLINILHTKEILNIWSVSLICTLTTFASLCPRVDEVTLMSLEPSHNPSRTNQVIPRKRQTIHSFFFGQEECLCGWCSAVTAKALWWGLFTVCPNSCVDSQSVKPDTHQKHEAPKLQCDLNIAVTIYQSNVIYLPDQWKWLREFFIEKKVKILVSAS